MMTHLLCILTMIICGSSPELTVLEEEIIQVEAIHETGPEMIRFGPAPGDDALHMFKVDQYEAIRWTCKLEGTIADLYNPPEYIITGDGSYLVICEPDCFSSQTPMQLVSDEGEPIWSTGLGSPAILLEEEFYELPPRISVIRELENGDFLTAGRVSPFLGAPAAWFITIHNRTTGKMTHSTYGYELGFAQISDIVQLDSGELLAAGATALPEHPDGAPGPIATAGRYRPLLILLSASGEVISTWSSDMDLTASFSEIVPQDEAHYLIRGTTADREWTETVIRLSL